MKTQIPPIDLQAEFHQIRSELLKRTQLVLSSGRYVLGKEVDEFERRFARFVGTKYAVGVASGSDALLLALMALGVGKGDEVITTPFSFVATATVIARLGARPVFVDVEPETFGLNPDLIERKLTKRTRGILPVHLYGNPCRMDRIMSIARKHHLFVVEDCAQACGAIFRGKEVGSFGEFGAFSFYPTKTLGALGDAGAVTMNQRDLYEKIRSLRHHGSDRRDHSYRHETVGINSRLDELQAAVLNVKLEHLAKWNQARRRVAERYREFFMESGLSIVRLPKERGDGKAVYHQYTIRTPKRDGLLKHLHRQGIAAGIYYPFPLHLQPCFRYLGYKRGDFPQAERASREVLSLPLYPQIRANEQRSVVLAIKSFLL